MFHVLPGCTGAIAAAIANNNTKLVSNDVLTTEQLSQFTFNVQNIVKFNYPKLAKVLART